MQKFSENLVLLLKITFFDSIYTNTNSVAQNEISYFSLFVQAFNTMSDN